jgi:hypothetical protein
MLTGNDMFYTTGFCPLLATTAFFKHIRFQRRALFLITSMHLCGF